jgi:hypothetical protein
MNRDIRKKLEDLNKLLAFQEGPYVNDQIQTPPNDPWADELVRVIEQGLDPNTEDGRKWWQLNFQEVINTLGGVALFWVFIRWLKNNGWTSKKIADLLLMLKGRCPKGSTAPCCIAIKRLTDVLHNWSNGHPDAIPGLIDAIGEISTILSVLSGCDWARSAILALLESYLKVYFKSLGLSDEQILELIKKILDWILNGANPDSRPVLIPSGGSSPDSETCKPNKDKIEQNLWEKYRDQIQNVGYAIVVLAAIAAIIAAALAACGGTFVGCSGLPVAMTAIIALLARIGINIGEDEARQLMEDQASAAGCVGTGTEAVMASDRIKALRAALRKKLPT